MKKKFVTVLCTFFLICSAKSGMTATLFSYPPLQSEITQCPDQQCTLPEPPIPPKPRTPGTVTTVLPELNSCCSGISDLSILRRQEVRSALFLYLTDGRDYAERGIGRADRYICDVDAVFKSHPDIPREMMMLPLLESGYCPSAVSRMKAVGAWQIIAPTARDLKLTIDPWIDERRNVTKSTDAAIHHLTYLYQTFGRWDFALAAYNGGSNRVFAAIRKHRTDDFWQLVEKNAFRKETNDYIPQFAALALIYYNRDLFGIQPEAMTETEFENYTLAYPVRIDELARIAGTNAQMIYRLNPELNAAITPPSRGHYTIKLPEGSIEKIKGNENTLYKVKFSRLTTHRVRKGESIQKISRIYGIDAAKIIYVNAMIKPYYLRAGKDILIPKS